MNIGKAKELAPTIVCITAVVITSLMTGIRVYHCWGINATINVAILLAIGVISAVSWGMVLSRRNVRYWAIAACAGLVAGIAIARFYPKIADAIFLSYCFSSVTLILLLVTSTVKEELKESG